MRQASRPYKRIAGKFFLHTIFLAKHILTFDTQDVRIKGWQVNSFFKLFFLLKIVGSAYLILFAISIAQPDLSSKPPTQLRAQRCQSKVLRLFGYYFFLKTMPVSIIRRRLDLQQQEQLDDILIELHNIDAYLLSLKARQDLTMQERWEKIMKKDKRKVLRQQLYALIHTTQTEHWHADRQESVEEERECVNCCSWFIML